MSSSRLPFEATLRQLEALNEAAIERRRRNSQAMTRFIDRLDDPLYSPQSEGPTAAPSRSIQPQTQELTTDDRGLRDLVPPRTNGNGGPYGDAILARVARNYGL